MPDFEWEIIDESPEDAPSTPRPPKQRRSLRRVTVFALLVVAAAVTALLAEANRQVEEKIAETRKDVLASHALMQRAAASSDYELLNATLGGTSEWRGWQLQMFENRLIAGRDALGLTRQTGASDTDDVRLSADLSQAEVVSERTYWIAAQYGLTETFQLQHTSMYRFDEQYWTLTPPDDAFWGDSQTFSGEMLTVIYPGRDQVIVERLAADLDSAFQSLCAALQRPLCPDGTRLRITLSSEPASLLGMLPLEGQRVIVGLDHSLGFTLPTPTLFGMPVDEASYRALLRTYAERIARFYAGTFSGFREGGYQQLYYQALFEKALAEQGLRPWPLTPATGGDPSIPLPDQDMLVYCVESTREGGHSYRYTPATDAWLALPYDRPTGSILPLPSGSGVVLQEIPDGADDPHSRLWLWQDGRTRVVLDAPRASTPLSFTGQTDPSSRRLVIAPDAFRPGLALLDLSDCTASGCSLTELSGMPTWSPDGSSTIVAGLFENTLSRGDRLGQAISETEPGLSPFWMSNSTYGYVALTGDAPYEVVTVDTDSNQVRRLLTLSDLWEAIPDRGILAQYGIDHVIVRPGHTEQLLVRVSDYDRAIAHWFSFDTLTGDLSRLPLPDGGTFYQVSGDGRWLAVTVFEPNDAHWTLHVWDLAQERLVSYAFVLAYPQPLPPMPSAHWSDDGRWLLVLNDGVLHLIAPEHDYERTVMPKSPGCMAAAWIRR